jgi:hypothetical protein
LHKIENMNLKQAYNLLFSFFWSKMLNQYWISMLIWFANPVIAQKSNWYLFQPNNQGVNVAFTNNGCSQGSNYFKPLKPYSNQPFTNYLSVNSQTDVRGKILFYVLSTMDSVYLFNSNNVCVKVFAGYDLSPTIIPLPGGIRYHLIVGTQLYWFGLRDLTIVNNDVFDFQNATVSGLVKINVSAQDPKYVAKRAVKVIKYSCDTFIYRLYSLEANYAGNTGRYVVSRDIVTIGGHVFTNSIPRSKQLNHVNNDNNDLIDINLEYTISEMELSPNQNELIFSGGSCLLRVDVSGQQFGGATRTCFNSNTTINDSSRFFCGIEYITDTLVLLSQFQTHDSTSVNQGLYLYNKVNNSFTKVANSMDFKYSYIERGKDGKIYVSKSDGLYKYDKNSNTVSRVIQLSLVPSVPFLKLIFNELDKPEIRVFYLPNAIDNNNNEILKDFQSVVRSIEIKSPPLPEKQLYTNAGHNLTPKGSGEILILDSLIITNIADWVVFDSMTIQFAEGSFLRIMGGSDLELKGTTLMGACGDMWNGVEIVQNSSMDSRLICRKNAQGRRTVIRDALIGVQTRNSNHGIKTSDSTLFIANKVGMKINNAYPSMYNITNTFFIDSLILNNGEKAQSAISTEKASLKIGNKDSLPVVVIGGELGIMGAFSQKIEIQNVHFYRTEKNAINVISTDIININNTKTMKGCTMASANAAIFLHGFAKFDFKRNLIIHDADNPSLLVKTILGSKIKIGGQLSDSNQIIYYNGQGVMIDLSNANFYQNSVVRNFENFSRPVSFVPFPYFTLNIENNRIVGKNSGYGISVFKNVAPSGVHYSFDTLLIAHNKLDVQNGILLNQIAPIEQNKILPLESDWSSGVQNRHISANRFFLKQYDPYFESVAISLDNTDHIYCVGNSILNTGLPGYSSAYNNCAGIRLSSTSNTLVFKDSFLGLYRGVELCQSNMYSNIYCNLFFYNWNSIKLNNTALRLNFDMFPVPSFNRKVHGMLGVPNYIARSNTFLGQRFNGSIFNNDKLSRSNNCKWILESTTFSNPYLLSNPKNKGFVFSSLGQSPCGLPIPNPNAFDNKDVIATPDAVIDPVDLFWNDYFNVKYNIIQAKSQVGPSFFKELIALELALDTGSISQIETALVNLTPIDSIQSEIKQVFSYWTDFISHYDTLFENSGLVRSYKIWDNDSSWHSISQNVDTMVFVVKYKSLSDSIQNVVTKIARCSPFRKRPASFFARNLLVFMGIKSGYVDSAYSDLVPITGRVTASCFGGGVQGILVKLFDEYHNNTGVFAISEAAGYFRFSGEEIKNLDTSRKYYVRVFLPTDSNHISATAKLWNLQNDSLLNIDCVFPGVQPLSILNQENSEIKIDPNPASDVIVISGLIQGNNYKLSILNSLGTLIFNKNIENDTNQKVRLDISGLVDGVYYLRLESDGKLCSIKVIVQQ